LTLIVIVVLFVAALLGWEFVVDSLKAMRSGKDEDGFKLVEQMIESADLDALRDSCVEALHAFRTPRGGDR
jgi:hypothetical protein